MFSGGRTSRGYYLHRPGKGDSGYILVPPDNAPGEIKVDLLGWKEPFIIVRPVDKGDQWVVIDARAHQRTVSEGQRIGDPNYRGIPIYHAAMAWSRLRRSKQW